MPGNLKTGMQYLQVLLGIPGRWFWAAGYSLFCIFVEYFRVWNYGMELLEIY